MEGRGGVSDDGHSLDGFVEGVGSNDILDDLCEVRQESAESPTVTTCSCQSTPSETHDKLDLIPELRVLLYPSISLLMRTNSSTDAVEVYKLLACVAHFESPSASSPEALLEVGEADGGAEETRGARDEDEVVVGRGHC